MANDPLTDLLLDEQEIDRARLARVLRGVLGVDENTGSLVIKPGFNELNSKRKVLSIILGKKASFLLKKSDSDLIQTKEIPGITGIPKGTVNPKLRELFDERLVSQTENGEYYIASHQILLAIEMLEKEK